jgi:long-chain acyl-CoA synthetase
VEPVALTGAPGVQPAGEPAAAPLVFPAWNRGLMARWLRRLSLDTWVLPLARLFIGLRVDGLDHLAAVDGPVIFAANHQSHFDTPAVLMALPQARRHRVAVAMAKEFFAAHFAPAGRPWRAVLTNRINYVLAALYFNAFPLPQREVGTRQTLRYVGDLVGDGYSVLIFPEGRRTDRGEIAPFRQGVAMVGSRLGVPIVPIRLDGLDRILHHSWKRPRRGRAAVIFGRPIVLADDDYVEGARRIEHAVRALGPGAPGPADS